MCYFDQNRWSCGYWKWSHFRAQCEREYRMGETCGLKLVNAVIDQSEKCRICQDIDRKLRKISKMDTDLGRWRHEGNRAATIDKTLDDRKVASEQIAALQQKHEDDIKKLS